MAVPPSSALSSTSPHPSSISSSAVQSSSSKRSLLIIELEGLSSGQEFEEELFNQQPHAYDKVEFIRANLSPGGDDYLPKEQIARFKNLKVVVRCGVGYDRLDRVALAERGIMVCNVPDYGTDEVADHALALALTLRRGLLIHHDAQRANPPAGWIISHSPLVRRINGGTFAILGLGRIGMAAGLRAKAFGWRVIFYDPHIANGVDKALQFTRVSTLEELFSQATSVLSIHCPHTIATRRLVSDRLLDLLPQGSILINTARGEVVELDAVYRALKSGRLAGAGLDSLEVEPIPDPAPMLIQAYRAKEEWLEGRLIITPHSAFYSPASFEDIRRKSAETMRLALVDGIRGTRANEILPTDE